MVRPPDSPIKRALKAAIVHLTVQKHVAELKKEGKTTNRQRDLHIGDAGEIIKDHLEKNPNFGSIPTSKRSLYTLMAEHRKLQRLARLLPMRKRFPK